MVKPEENKLTSDKKYVGKKSDQNSGRAKSTCL